MGLDMRVSGIWKLIKEMEEGIRFGQMVHYMRVIGRMTRLMVGEG